MDAQTTGLSPRAPFWQREGYLQTYVDFLLRELNPALSRRVLLARVMAIIPETADTRTYVLSPPRRWRGFTAGMHVPVSVQLNGAWVRRTYTISSPPGEYQRRGMIAITVKRIPGGKVSNGLYDQLKVGQWLRIGEAGGEFTLERARADKVLFLAAGSGITPFFAMLNAHLSARTDRQITLMYYCRTAADVIFATRLAELSERHSHFRLVPVLTDTQGRISIDHLRRYCPDVAGRSVFLCGPTGFMDTATRLLRDVGVPEAHIVRESFGARFDAAALAGVNRPAEVTFTCTAVRIQGDGSKTVLELAEQAGLRPKHGCRSGLCFECKCTKLGGQVVDIRNGQRSGMEQEDIQICISIPQGPVDIAL